MGDKNEALIGSGQLISGRYDKLYYDTDLLSRSEAKKSQSLPEGSVLVVFPGKKNHFLLTGNIAVWMIKKKFVKNLVVTGVGSSSQGTAAFAKTVANKLDTPVAGIVSGQGDFDVEAKAHEGHYIGRVCNRDKKSYFAKDSEKLVELFLMGARFERLIGHSKGNMDIANALYRLQEVDKGYLSDKTSIYTFACGVNVPESVKDLKQFMGGMDMLGSANTTSYSNMRILPGRLHTTNPTYQLTYLPVESLLS